MKKLLFVLFIALAAITSFFVELFYCSASLLESFRGFVRERAVMFATFLSFVFISVSANAADLAEGVTFFGILVETWAMLPLYAQIIGVLWLLVPVFSVVVSLTDTPMDDNLWGKWIYPILEKLAMVSFKAKQKPGDSYLLKPFK
tara:strand:+ start:7472 stop:7906 length:435 start_codon:yes stop_codon:yes gene_type:complete